MLEYLGIGLIVIGILLLPFIIKAVDVVLKVIIILVLVSFVYWGATNKLPKAIDKHIPSTKIENGIDQIVDFWKDCYDIVRKEGKNAKGEIKHVADSLRAVNK